MSDWKGYGPDNTAPTVADVAETGPQSAVSAGALTYEPHYGLKAKPFSLSTDPRTLFTAPGHAEALDDLLAAIRRREGLIVVTGQMGTGKTTLCRAALYQLDRKTFTTFVPDPFISREDLLRTLLVEFGEVSVEDLRKGRLSSASRPDLSYQLFEFLTSLESVDAFAVLVIDEAQHLGSQLLEEIRALSELEAGRKLLQIVLVGQPELESHLKKAYMRQIDQRVTTRCELKPLTRDEVTGYVSHRLALAGGTRDRVSFSPAALDLVYEVSAGIPRVINLMCDRALMRGQVEQVAVISPVLVGKAMEDLRLGSAPAIAVPDTPPATMRIDTPGPRPSADPFAFIESQVPHAPRATAARNHDLPPVAAADLNDLLELAPTFRHDPEPAPDQGFVPLPAWKTRVAAERTRQKARFRFLRSLLLPFLGMSIMLVAGGLALKAQRLQLHDEPASAWSNVPVRSEGGEATRAPQTISPSQVPGYVPAGVLRWTAPIAPILPPPVDPAASRAAIASIASNDAWVVQVAVFSSAGRSAALVERLTEAGMPAYQVVADSAQGALHIVRVGPYRGATEADDIRAQIRRMPALEDAFVRNVTTTLAATH
jgi:type II secretory pathway predicted ATPase ExeA/cell division septation protein DedD